MRFSVLIAALVGVTVSIATAIPAEDVALEARRPQAGQFDPCTNALASPQCCATDILGIANLDCAPPPSPPKSFNDFRRQCASIGQRARCCLLPLAGQGLICTAPN